MSTGVGTGFTFTDDKNPFEVSDEMCGFRLLQQKKAKAWYSITTLEVAAD